MNLTDGVLAADELRAAVAHGTPETIARTAMSHLWPLYSEHFDELTRVVETLPPPVLTRYPALRVLHRMTPVLARTTRPFKPLVDPDNARAMAPDELDFVTLAQIVAFRFSGDVAAALIYARRLEERIQQFRETSFERTDGPLWFYHHQIGSTFLAAGDTSRALLEFATSRQLGRLSQQPDAERAALGRIALAHAVRGSLDDAELALAAVATQPPATPAHRASTAATERTAAAIIGVERMAPNVEDLLADLERYDSIELTWPFALLARTRALIALQRPDEAIEVVRLTSEAHPDQHGSVASDVIAAASVHALWALGAPSAARRVAESSPRGGLLSKLAIARLALLECRWEAADAALQRLAADPSFGPGPRVELLLMSAWHEYGSTDTVAPGTAAHVARLAARDGSRRIVSMMPVQLVDSIREALPAAEAAVFEREVSGLAHVDAPRRPTLTRGELRVLNILPAHTTTAQIAAVIHVSPNTVKSQLKSLYRKLGCSTREDAMIIASRFHLLAEDGG
ncbi:response regulator transcription factor [Microbacterium sp. NPDC055988]|uniref:response regulator transcription factor n=1 Tax=Microbacterium sp. NPDC055988 TaxID=3345671 RepID=UPI0035DC2AE7